jgi:hypothetical protein
VVQKRLIILALAFLVLNAVLLAMFTLGSPTVASEKAIKAGFWKAIYSADPTMKDRINLTKLHQKPERLSANECMACHGDMKNTAKIAKNSNIRVNVHFHLTLSVANFSCTDCHRTDRVWSESTAMNIIKTTSKQVVQSTAAPAVKFGTTSEGSTGTVIRINRFFCFKCHSGFDTYVKKGAMKADYQNLECTMCHRGKIAPRHQQPFLSQVLSTTECLMCHGNNLFPWPKLHYETVWSTQHGQTAAKDFTVCWVCHQKATFCDRCHTTKPITHDSSWRQNHKANYKERPERCKTCHTSDFCNTRCHGVNHTANWRNDHATTVVEKGREFCMNCHYLGFCFSCHNQTGRLVPTIDFNNNSSKTSTGTGNN